MAKPVPTGPDSEEEKPQVMKAPEWDGRQETLNIYLKKVEAWKILQEDETESTSWMDVKQEKRKGAAMSSFSHMESGGQ